MVSDVRTIVVCGTCFGEHYLAAIASMPDRYRLGGIVARGSDRSVALAEHFGVPLFRSVDDLPASGIDIACVVVRTTLFGGEGTKLATAFLQRGIHVLQEHPVHPSEVASLRRVAQANGVRYHVNSFYPHLPAPGNFIAYAQAAATRAAPAFADITTSPQLLYSTLDILGRGIGGLGAFRSFGPLAPASEGLPFHAVQGVAGKVPFSLMLQSYLDPADPDHHSLVMHRMAIGWPEGTVNLVNSFGPVIWSNALYAPDYRKDGVASSYLLSPQTYDQSHYFTQPSALALGCAGGEAFRTVAYEQFPGAIGNALAELRQAIEMPDSVRWQSDTYLVELGQAWVTILRQAGAPRQKTMPPPPPPHPDPVAFAQAIFAGQAAGQTDD